MYDLLNIIFDFFKKNIKYYFLNYFFMSYKIIVFNIKNNSYESNILSY